MALGAYSFSIATCHLYPFQLPWLVALVVAGMFSGICGLILGIPVLRLRGDYLAIVTLGFGEIVQDSLRNLEVITKGTQGINPIPAPSIGGIAFEEASKQYWYVLLVSILLISIGLIRYLERSSSGRAWAAIRDNELAARCVGIRVDRAKVSAMVISSALCGMAGGLWVSFLGSSGEPGTYDFQVSVVVLCGLILGGLGTLWGALVGTMIMVGLNSLVLTKLTQWMTSVGLASTTTVWASPTNWKYLIFGSALILMMRYRPAGLFPEELRR
jgi:branched-chain amino acid transport system permease protein